MKNRDYMRPGEIAEYIRAKSGLTVAISQLHHWEQDGLLGEIPKNEKTNHRHYTKYNADRAVMVAMLKAVGQYNHQINDIISGESITSKQTLADLINSYETKILPKLKELINVSTETS